MHGDRPWDFPQRFAADSDGDVTPLSAVDNNISRNYGDADEREEVRELVHDARQRHYEVCQFSASHSVKGVPATTTIGSFPACGECATS